MQAVTYICQISDFFIRTMNTALQNPWVGFHFDGTYLYSSGEKIRVEFQILSLISTLSRKADYEAVEVQVHQKNPGNFRKLDSNVKERGNNQFWGKQQKSTNHVMKIWILFSELFHYKIAISDKNLQNVHFPAQNICFHQNSINNFLLGTNFCKSMSRKNFTDKVKLVDPEV